MKVKFVIMILCLSVLQLSAQDYTWKAGKIDGSRTGCSVPSKNNISETVGYFERGTYVAPNGHKFKKNMTTAKTAEVVIGAQPAMERVKDVIAQSSQAMSVQYPEGPLSNWFVDILMRKAEALSGKKVDVGVANFGGIRVNMPEGDVTLDDMLSMFPFKNQVIYVEHKGITLRKMLEKMAAGRFEVLGGVRVVAEDGKLVSAEIDGEPIDDNKVYGVATVSFLLYGGDGLRLADDAVSLKKFDVDIIDAVLEHVHAETAAGRTIQYESDGRVIIRK